ncbi:hornerin-like [Zerene cesonia]|uniref:hornerin-like n=1 Tax=Zerene cesonia TaxID=33412 RepID=UPI0018E583A7|nr:hornerin-like [Zerene cesonia]
MKIPITILCVATATSAVQIGAPATGYIYRNDHNGPASLIQLGAHYQQPNFLPALPIAAPIKTIEAYDIAPVPLPYIAAKPIVIEDAEDESSEEESAEYSDGLVGLGHEGGGGSEYEEAHHKEHGEKGSKGYHSKGHFAKGQAGNYGEVHKEGHHSEGSGEKGAHHDEADSYGKHHKSGKGYKGGDHGHKKYHSKGEDITGYHKVFNKDEFKKDHDFYDVADNSGHFKKHGSDSKHYSEHEGGHKEGEKGVSGFDKGDFGKSGYHNKGHIDDGEAEHVSKEGEESHYNHHEGYGKKGGKSHEKEYEYYDDDEE